MTGIGQSGVQAPEHLNDTQSRLRNRLGNVTARGRYSADYAQSALASLLPLGDDPAGTLIELGQTASQIGGITFLTGHLFQTAGHFTKRLRPTGGRIGHQCYRVAHIPEILGDGDTSIDRSLTRRNRHIGGVRDQNGTLHQGIAGFGVLQLRELVQNVGHLVAALAAADINDNIRLGPLSQLMLHNGFARPKGTRNRRDAAFGDGEQRINNTLTGDQRHIRRQFFLVGTAFSNRPALHQC